MREGNLDVGVSDRNQKGLSYFNDVVTNLKRGRDENDEYIGSDETHISKYPKARKDMEVSSTKHMTGAASKVDCAVNSTVLTLDGVKALGLEISDCEHCCAEDRELSDLLLKMVSCRINYLSSVDEQFRSQSFLNKFGWCSVP